MRKRLPLLSLIICLAAMLSIFAAACNFEVDVTTVTTFSISETTITDNVDTTEDTESSDREQVESSSDMISSEESSSDVTSPEKSDPSIAPSDSAGLETEAVISEDGEYTTKEDVALYIHLYGHLPSNFVTKKQAQSQGWKGGSLENYFPGCSIGGDVFGNREGLLPKKDGRKYYECDIDTKGAKSRGAKRIVFSNDGLVYYTDDHYESFTLLYGEE